MYQKIYNMFNNQEGFLKEAGQNEDVVELYNNKVRVGRDSFLALVKVEGTALAYVNKDWAVANPKPYYEIALAAVQKYPMALEYVNDTWAFKNAENAEMYKEIALHVVQKDGYVLGHVNKDWAVENSESYYDIALASVEKTGFNLEYVHPAWVLANPQQYYEIVKEAVERIGYALAYVNHDWVLANSEEYSKIVLEAVKDTGFALHHVHPAWVLTNSTQYYEIALAAVNKNAAALHYVHQNWVLQNSEQYYDIALAAVSQNGNVLDYIDKNWVLENVKKYEKIVLVAVRHKPYALKYINRDWVLKESCNKIVLVAVKVAFKNSICSNDFFNFFLDFSILKYAGEVFRNNIKIAISLLMDLDREYFDNNSISRGGKIANILSITCQRKNDILLYAYMLNNKTVSNNFKNALFKFLIKEFKLSDNFMLYKNILECYLALSNGYQEKFIEHKLLENLSDDHSKQLHMFFSVADPSALNNTELANLLNNKHHHIIKDYLTKYNLQCSKNSKMYPYLLKSLFVVDYDKIIKKINENNINIMQNDDLMRLVLCYFTIEDLLELSNDKLEVKYLNIDLEFQRPDGYTSTGIEALVDAIKANNGSLSNTGKYHTFDTAYNLLDIEPSLHDKFIEI